MRLREFFFKYRSYTPLPFIIAALILAEPTLITLISGFIVVATGEITRLWSVRYAGSATRTTGKVGADELVTTGPYSHVRNPLYLGNILIAIGFVFMAFPWMPWMLILLCIFLAIQYGAIISLEEDFLLQKFSSIYSDYKNSVPRLIPRLKSWQSGSRKPTELKKAMRTERRTLQSLALISFAIVIRWFFN